MQNNDQGITSLEELAHRRCKHREVQCHRSCPGKSLDFLNLEAYKGSESLHGEMGYQTEVIGEADVHVYIQFSVVLHE